MHISESDRQAIAAAGFLCEYWLRWADDAARDAGIAAICGAEQARAHAGTQSFLAFRRVRGAA